MKNVPDLQTYLRDQGVTETTSADEVAMHKRRHRRLYLQAYDQQRRQNKTRVTHWLDKETHQALDALREEISFPGALPEFIRTCAEAYAKQLYVPVNVEAIEALTQQVRHIGNNINQVVHKFHLEQAFEDAGKYEILRAQVEGLAVLVDTFCRRPQEVQNVSTKTFCRRPQEVLEPEEVGAYLVRLFQLDGTYLNHFEDFLREQRQQLEGRSGDEAKTEDDDSEV